MNLTELEKDVLIAIATNEFCDEPGDWAWSYSIHYKCTMTTQKQLPGVISSLIKKGLAEHDDAGGEGDCVRLTKKGIEAFKTVTSDG